MATEHFTKGDARRRIAANIRKLRSERGLSQERLAELADFHRTYVSQLERCVTNVSIDGLERKTRMNRLIEQLGLEKVRNNKGFQLSGGERRRVEIARAPISERRLQDALEACRQ